tara:strand:- start:672 stop:1130 length:459 start_codon:yes stop_codon:yes gene_type:complete
MEDKNIIKVIVSLIPGEQTEIYCNSIKRDPIVDGNIILEGCDDLNIFGEEDKLMVNIVSISSSNVHGYFVGVLSALNEEFEDNNEELLEDLADSEERTALEEPIASEEPESEGDEDLGPEASDFLDSKTEELISNVVADDLDDEIENIGKLL